jgi:hypothetical protein
VVGPTSLPDDDIFCTIYCYRYVLFRLFVVFTSRNFGGLDP